MIDAIALQLINLLIAIDGAQLVHLYIYIYIIHDRSFAAIPRDPVILSEYDKGVSFITSKTHSNLVP